ncbi:MAG: RsmD family RNA methyltransferase [Phycisphaerales bacterium]
MRIIAGEFRRRLLEGPPKGATTRPLPDSVREAIFNLLRGHFEDADVLDLFAGTGSFGLEAVSRGARRVVMVERDKRVAEVLSRNAATIGAESRVEVVVSDALGPAALNRCPRPAHIIFLDPPYDLVRDPAVWPRVRAQAERLASMLTPTGYLLLRTPHPFSHELDPESGEAVAPAEAKRRKRERQAQAFDEAFESEAEELTPTPGRRLRPVSLALGGAVGPETHAYGSTAVHLYMRADAGGPGAPGA